MAKAPSIPTLHLVTALKSSYKMQLDKRRTSVAETQPCAYIASVPAEADTAIELKHESTAKNARPAALRTTNNAVPPPGLPS